MNVEKVILRKVKECNEVYSLFDDSEKLVIALSGGKDSMSLLKILAHVHPPSLLYPVHIYPYRDDKILLSLTEFCAETLSIPNPVIFAENPLYKTGGESCYVCARGRRMMIFKEAERLKIEKIALGHTKNDVAETFLMNILYSGNTDTLRPVQNFFQGKFQVVRPFYLVEERDIIRYSGIYKIEIQNYDCKGKANNKREVIRDFLKSVEVKPDKKTIHRVFISAIKSNLFERKNTC